MKMNQTWYYQFPIANLFFSLLIALFIGRKKHIGFGYLFFIGIGFTCIVSLIVALFATPITEPLKPTKRDVFFYVLVGLMILILCRSAYVAYENIGGNWGRGSLGSYFKAESERKMWQSIFLVIGSFTTLVFLFDRFEQKAEKVPIDGTANPE